jgi:hypothetical protein
MNFTFPEGFVLGVSSAATQIEGGYTGHSWNDWFDKGHIKDGSDPAVADDHWRRWREDVDLMADPWASAPPASASNGRGLSRRRADPTRQPPRDTGKRSSTCAKRA